MRHQPGTPTWRLVAAVGVATALVSVLPIGVATPAQAATMGNWNAGRLVSDAVFYNAQAMTAAQVQTLLDTRGASCPTGSTSPAMCLKNYKVATPATVAADAYCTKAYTGSPSGESAAQIIAKVAVSCGINPQVLLATMQKESSLVTKTTPAAADYSKAMGYGCPDTSACDPAYSGFFNQVRGAARQFQIYAAQPGLYTYYPGASLYIPYSTTVSCGGTNVLISNQATASLYNYTPFQPNAAALTAYPGNGDSCSSYGNRNFWALMTDWFDPVVRLWGATLVDTPVAISAAGWTSASWALVASGNKNNFPDAMAGAPLAYALTGHAPIFLTTNPKAGLEQQVIDQLAALHVSHVIILGGTAAVSQTIQDQLTPGPKQVAKLSGVVSVERLGGTTLYQTATKIADRLLGIPTSAGLTAAKPVNVFVTTGLNFPDALASSPIAALEGWPILFTPPKGHLNADTTAWLRLHQQSKIWVLGGTAAVSATAASDAQKLTAAKTTASVPRLSGNTLYDTAVAINTDTRLAAAMTTTFDKTSATSAITAAIGTNFPDALAGGVFAAMHKAPLFLIDGKATKPNTAVRTAIVTWPVSSVGTVYVFGGTSVMTDNAVHLHIK